MRTLGLLLLLAACGGKEPATKTLADYCPTPCISVTPPASGCYQQAGPYCQVDADPANNVPACSDLVKTAEPNDVMCQIGNPPGCIIERIQPTCS